MPRALVALILLTVASPLHAAPPRVLSATADNADLAVDPALTELRVVFDQDMDRAGHSICGGGPTFPLSGRPAWADARTLVLPVKLEPGKTYALNLNCPSSSKSLRSGAGEPLDAYPISFTTRAPGDPAPDLAPADARAMSAALRTAVRDRYSFETLRRVDWDAAFARHAEALESAPTPSAFARAAARLLAEADDPHVTLRVGPVTLGTARTPAKTNFDLAVVRRLVKDLEQRSPRVFTGTYAGTPYLLITDWSGPAADYDPVYAFIDKVQDLPNLIIDVRPNAGGDERRALAVASRFARVKAVYATHKVKDPAAPGGWRPQQDRTVEPCDDCTRFDGKVAVLMGGACMSSNESFLLMMRSAARARTFGARSRGSSGNPQPVDLGHGVTVNLPTWVVLTPDGDFLEGRGLAPDVEVDSDIEGTDPVLGTAYRLLTEK